mmetsp:Transcript_170674/g.547458  ORF Transcript_170674/g.547458 Transcript_170674/m.547458 type:complete len:221 (+) Transcript_170674:7839-8501(+)
MELVEDDFRALLVVSKSADLVIRLRLGPNPSLAGGAVGTIRRLVLQVGEGIDGAAKGQVFIGAQQTQHVVVIEAPAGDIDREGGLRKPPPSLADDGSSDDLASHHGPIRHLVAIGVAVAHGEPAWLRDLDGWFTQPFFARGGRCSALTAVALANWKTRGDERFRLGVIGVSGDQPVTGDDVRLLRRQALDLPLARPVRPTTLVPEDLHLAGLGGVGGSRF